MKVWSVWLGLGLLFGLLSCGNTRRETPDAPCADDVCGSAGQGGQGGGSTAACEGPDCPICTEGERFCQEGDVFACTQQGKSINAVELCASGSVCDPETISCVPQICQPEAATCSGTQLGTCNALGTKILPGDVDCADEEKLCVNGQCMTCIPGQRHCLNDDVVLCDDVGEEYAVEQECLEAYHCAIVPPGVATCLADVCVPGATSCVANAVKTCTEYGGWAEDFEQCPAYGQCVDAGCVVEECTPQDWLCVGNGVYECNEAGVPDILVQACEPTQNCVAEPGPASCRDVSCTPGERLCIDDRVGTCAYDGLAFVLESDCRASGQLCVSPTCQIEAAEQTGVSTDCESVKPGDDTHVTVGNAFQVTVPRRLVELAVEMNLAEAVVLRWVLGSEPVDGVFALTEIVTTSDGPGSRFFSSGPIDVVLQPGKTYMLGVSIGGDASICFDPSPPARVSFGVQSGSQRGDTTTAQSYDPNRTFTFLLTTRP